MKDERTKAEKLAFTLRYLVDKGHIPGLLPRDVLAAADLLVAQEVELDTASKALATKRHIVEATAKTEHYRTKIRGTFIIADPRIYCGEIQVNDRAGYVGEFEWERHIARQLTRAATDDWLREMEGSALVAVRQAIAAGSRDGGDVKQAPCEASQNGGESRIAQPPSEQS